MQIPLTRLLTKDIFLCEGPHFGLLFNFIDRCYHRKPLKVPNVNNKIIGPPEPESSRFRNCPCGYLDFAFKQWPWAVSARVYWQKTEASLHWGHCYPSLPEAYSSDTLRVSLSPIV